MQPGIVRSVEDDSSSFFCRKWSLSERCCPACAGVATCKRCTITDLSDVTFAANPFVHMRGPGGGPARLLYAEEKVAQTWLKRQIGEFYELCYGTKWKETLGIKTFGRTDAVDAKLTWVPRMLITGGHVHTTRLEE